MLFGNVVNQFHDQYRFANTGTAEQTDFTALCIRCNQVNDLNASFQNFSGSLLLIIRRRIAMNRPAFDIFRRRLIINRLTKQVKNTSQTLLTDWNRNRRTAVHSLGSAHQSIRTAHSNTANNIVANMLRNLDRQLFLAIFNFNSVQKLRQLAIFKSNIQYRSNNLNNGTDASFSHSVAPLIHISARHLQQSP